MLFVTKLWLSSKEALSFNSSASKEKMRAIAYSMDLLLPGLYLWLPGGFSLRLGGDLPDQEVLVFVLVVIYQMMNLINIPEKFIALLVLL
ncbi:hypothetical protein [Nostoc sp. TCL26-01]|uniref:hypothetical protein n=1 Tax=Nostoc sp. TCL26-01 TaxID=2576904 RepID=UPI00211811B5|nr:hypothetical protein [Nostoc sp. TCL26-01]